MTQALQKAGRWALMEPALSRVLRLLAYTRPGEAEVSNSEQLTKARSCLPAAKASTNIACGEKPSV